MHKNQRRFVCLLSVAVLVAIFGFNAYAQSASNAGTGSIPAQPTSQPNASAPDKSTPDKPADVSVNVNVVNALVTVRDKHGALVKNLGKDDFVLTADGAPQTIHYFSQESNLPLTLGLLVDTSVSQRNVLDEERTDSYKFLDQMLHQEKDVAFVIHFDREVELLQDVTSSRPKLEEALHSLQIVQSASNDDDTDSHAPQGPGTGNQQPHQHVHHGGTDLYDAIYLASNELMKDQHGRKALVVLTDGVDHGSKETLASAVESAERADTMVYSIYFKSDEEPDHQGGFGHRRISMGGGGYPGGGGRPGGGQRYPQQETHVDGKKVLQQISLQTGGRFFEVSKKDTVESIYAQIQDELRSQYNLGFTPTQQAAEAGYHKIQLTTKKKDLTVQTREGYYKD